MTAALRGFQLNLAGEHARELEQVARHRGPRPQPLPRPLGPRPRLRARRAAWRTRWPRSAARPRWPRTTRSSPRCSRGRKRWPAAATKRAASSPRWSRRRGRPSVRLPARDGGARAGRARRSAPPPGERGRGARAVDGLAAPSTRCCARCAAIRDSRPSWSACSQQPRASNAMARAQPDPRRGPSRRGHLRRPAAHRRGQGRDVGGRRRLPARRDSAPDELAAFQRLRASLAEIGEQALCGPPGAAPAGRRDLGRALARARPLGRVRRVAAAGAADLRPPPGAAGPAGPPLPRAPARHPATPTSARSPGSAWPARSATSWRTTTA